MELWAIQTALLPRSVHAGLLPVITLTRWWCLRYSLCRTVRRQGGRRPWCKRRRPWCKGRGATTRPSTRRSGVGLQCCLDSSHGRFHHGWRRRLAAGHGRNMGHAQQPAVLGPSVAKSLQRLTKSPGTRLAWCGRPNRSKPPWSSGPTSRLSATICDARVAAILRRRKGIAPLCSGRCYRPKPARCTSTALLALRPCSEGWLSQPNRAMLNLHRAPLRAAKT